MSVGPTCWDFFSSGQGVGRQVHDVAGDHRRDALVQRRQPHHRVLPVLHAVDVLRPQPRLDDEFILQRQQLHDALAGLDYAAARMIAQLHHDAADRRRDADPIEYALGAEHPLADVGEFAPDLVHLFDRGLDRGLAHAVDLLDSAGDPFLGVADVAHDAADLAFQIGLRAAAAPSVPACAPVRPAPDDPWSRFPRRAGTIWRLTASSCTCDPWIRSSSALMLSSMLLTSLLRLLRRAVNVIC